MINEDEVIKECITNWLKTIKFKYKGEVLRFKEYQHGQRGPDIEITVGGFNGQDASVSREYLPGLSDPDIIILQEIYN